MPPVRSQPPRQTLYRVLSQKSAWRELWGSIKRVHKDRRARRRLGFVSPAIGLGLLLVVAAIVYVMVLIGTGSVLFVPFVIPLLWWIRRRTRKEFQPMSIAPQASALLSEKRDANTQALHTHFGELALLYAVLVDRAGSERFLKEKPLPAGVEVTTRRAHMDALRSANLWERIGLKDREALMIADGGWDWEQINRFAMGIEPLRLLRWVLRIDFRLPTIGQQLSGDFGIAHEIVVDCERLWRGRQLIDADTVRSSRDDARTTLLRCIAEAISRGYQVAADDEMAAWAKKISDDLAGNQNEDFLLGDKLVSEATREQLGWATALANIRSDFLAMVLECLEAGHPP